jgi:NAD(P)-dependent dehydrogenase (short-subunit alcohol dehydrogenase family)
MTDIDLTERTVVITGASRGLGAQLAKDFFKQGTRLILIARNSAKLQTLTQNLQQQYPSMTQHITTIACDLADPTQVSALAAQLRTYQRIDVLINNAAIQGLPGPCWESDWSDWQTVIQVNLLAPVALCRAIVPMMLNQGYGRVINIAGGGATNVRPNFSAYAVAKTGLVRFTENLASELNQPSILVNCVSPGVMNTDMLAEFLHFEQQQVGALEYQKIAAQAKTGDQTLSRASQLCLWLASAKADGITGKLISAVWDPWPQLDAHVTALQASDIYTLRRIMPQDREQVFS